MSNIADTVLLSKYSIDNQVMIVYLGFSSLVFQFAVASGGL